MALLQTRNKYGNNLLAGFNAQVHREDVRSPQGGLSGFGMPPKPGQPYVDPRTQTADAQEEMGKIDSASNLGKLGSFAGGLLGTMIPIPVLGPAIGSAAGGALGQMLGGIRPDFKDVVQYGSSGAIGGLAGAGMGQLFGSGAQALGGAAPAITQRLGAGTAGMIGNMVPYLQGQGALAGLGMAGFNTQYDPRYRYYFNSGPKENQPVY